jgi:predicted RNA-binding protein
MRSHKQRKTGQLTLGDLVVAATEVAFEVSKDEKKAYQIASIVVEKMLEMRPAIRPPVLTH